MPQGQPILRLQRRLHVVACLIIALTLTAELRADDTSCLPLDLGSGLSFESIKEADAFIWRVIEEDDGEAHIEATRVYEALLGCIDGSLAKDDFKILRRYLAQLGPLVPEMVEKQVQRFRPAKRSETMEVSNGLGRQLIVWWRSQDPIPVTAANERLIEHLERVSFSLANFGNRKSDSGFDDRGMIYTRLGLAPRKTKVDFRSTRLQTGIDSRLNLSDFKDNEYWVYPAVDTHAHYLFVREKGYYKISESSALIPRRLRSGTSRNSRNFDMLRAVMEEVYGQLALLNVEYGTAYSAAQDAAYINDSGSPHFETILSNRRSEERRAADLRDESVPRAFTTVWGAADRLKVEARIARFLEPDGRTRNEIYTGLIHREMRPGRAMRKSLRSAGMGLPTRYLIRTGSALRTSDYRHLAAKEGTAEVEVPDWKSDGVAHVQGDTLYTNEEQYYLGIQWEQIAVANNEDGTSTELRVKMNTIEADSLIGLNPDQGSLEVSDLKPMVLGTVGEVTGIDDLLAAATSFPFRTIRGTEDLILYFEVYHLNFGTNDRARFKVEYEVARESDGRLLSLRKKTDQTTTSSTEYEVESRTAKEIVALDLTEWADDGTLTVTVRVTDLVSGGTVERTVDFDLAQ